MPSAQYVTPRRLGFVDSVASQRLPQRLERVVMKCQKCDQKATFHITELTGGKPQELHLCEEHARDYLTQSDAAENEAPSLAGALAQQLVGQTAEELKRLDQRPCPVCGITFHDFRSQGRLGCPHDYVFFQKELQPLVLNIHGESQHVGKHPKRTHGDTDQKTELIRLRREMKAAVTEEDYEKASHIRDQIRQIEQAGDGGQPSGDQASGGTSS